MKKTCLALCLIELLLIVFPALAWDGNTPEFTISDVGDIYVEDFRYGYAPYYSGGLFGIVRYDGRIMSDAVYQDIKGYGEGMWPVQTEQGWKFVNMDGTTAIAGPFESASAFHCGVSVISTDGLYGTIAASGTYVVEPVWDYIAEYNDAGYTYAESEGCCALIDIYGNIITASEYDAITLYDDVCIGKRGRLHDIIDQDGCVMHTFRCDEISGCADGYITYRIGDTWQVSTYSGETEWQISLDSYGIEASFGAPTNGWITAYAKNDDWYECVLYNIHDDLYLSDVDWQCAYAISGGYIRAYALDGTYDYYDAVGIRLTDEHWQYASDFHYGCAVVYNGVEWYIIDDKFNEIEWLDGIVRSDFQDSGFENGYIVTQTDDGQQIIRIDGSAVEGGEYDMANGDIIGYRGEGGNIHIPEGVTGIADKAFKGNKTILSVSFPSTLKSIGASAFEGCLNLGGQISLSESVEQIGKYAFALTSVEMFEVDGWNAVYYSHNGGLATYDGVFLNYPAGNDSDFYSLPDGINRLENYSFANCSNLKYLEIPESIQDDLDIASRAFRSNDTTRIICNLDTHAADEVLSNDLKLMVEYVKSTAEPAPTAEPTVQPTVVPTKVPIPTATPEPTAIPGKIMVYFNVNGNYYHTTSNCSGMKNAGYFTLDDAIAYGKRRCPVCNPPVPTDAPTLIPTDIPTVAPTEEQTIEPTALPTDVPTARPTAMPTDVPTARPTAMPTDVPTVAPTDVPTFVPTAAPTEEPTAEPSGHMASDFMPKANVKYILSDGREKWTLLMDDGKRVAVVTHPDYGSDWPPASDYSYSVMYYYVQNGTLYYSDFYGNMAIALIHDYPSVGDTALDGGATIVCITDDVIHLSNGYALITDVGMVDEDVDVTSCKKLTDDEIAILKDEAYPHSDDSDLSHSQETSSAQWEEGTMFCESDLFAGFLLPGTSTRSELENGLGVIALDEYTESLPEQDYTVAEYAICTAWYDCYNVLVKIEVTADDFETVRGITLDNSSEEVFSTFYDPEEWVSYDDGIIYQTDTYGGHVRRSDELDGIIEYYYIRDNGIYVWLTFCFNEDDVMQYVTMYNF